MSALTVGDPAPGALADAPVLAGDGTKAALGSWWKDGPALVVFIRHFGCIGCSVHVRDLAPRLAELHDLGLRTVLVGNGAAEHLKPFIARNRLTHEPVDVVTDPSLESFRAAGLVRSTLGTFGPKAVYEGIRAFAAGHTQGRWLGTVNQQAGTVLIDRGGRVVWFHRSVSLTGHAPAVEVIDRAIALALQGLRGAV